MTARDLGAAATARPWTNAAATREAMMDEAVRGGPPVTMAARMVTHFDIFVAHAGQQYEQAEARLAEAERLLADLIFQMTQRGTNIDALAKARAFLASTPGAAEGES